MLEEYLFSKNTKWILWGAAGVLGAFLIFIAGVAVGSHQGGRVRPGPDGSGMMGGFVQNFMPREGYIESGHGAIGTVATVTLPTFTLISRSGTELKVYASTSTAVTGGTVNNTGALQNGQIVIVVGDPDDQDNAGYLEARIIHILPPR